MATGIPAWGGQLSCQAGAECVYQRYLDAGRAADLAAAGVTDAASFTALYWGEQLGSAGTIVILSALGGVGGAGLYWLFRPKPILPETVAAAR